MCNGQLRIRVRERRASGADGTGSSGVRTRASVAAPHARGVGGEPRRADAAPSFWGIVACVRACRTGHTAIGLGSGFPLETKLALRARITRGLTRKRLVRPDFAVTARVAARHTCGRLVRPGIANVVFDAHQPTERIAGAFWVVVEPDLSLVAIRRPVAALRVKSLVDIQVATWLQRHPRGGCRKGTIVLVGDP